MVREVLEGHCRVPVHEEHASWHEGEMRGLGLGGIVSGVTPDDWAARGAYDMGAVRLDERVEF